MNGLGLRFVTILAVALAGWILIMWFALSAIDASANAESDRSMPVPAAAVDIAPGLSGPAGYVGADLAPAPRDAHGRARAEGGV